jgi:competence protein ComEC
MRMSGKLFVFAALTPLLLFAAPAAKTLTFYTIDVEGGKAVLVLTPSGESMLFDAGWPADRNREASTDRIVAALQGAGLKQLDYLLISHFDIDHFGDVPALAARFPIRHFLDHGDPQIPPTSKARDRFQAYDELRQKAGHTVLKAGDKLPLKDVSVEVVAAAGRLLTKPLKGGGTANPLCAANPQAAAIERDVEDDQSIGLLFQFGSFRTCRRIRNDQTYCAA